MKPILLLLALALTGSGALAADPSAPTPAPEGARVYFISPQDGDIVEGPVTVRFGLAGMGVAPAGISLPNTGHHHLLVNPESLPAPGVPIPNDAQHRHFGGGQTEVTLNLEPGEHRLQLLLGDALHRPHQPPVTCEPIRITVKAGDGKSAP